MLISRINLNAILVSSYSCSILKLELFEIFNTNKKSERKSLFCVKIAVSIAFIRIYWQIRVYQMKMCIFVIVQMSDKCSLAILFFMYRVCPSD